MRREAARAEEAARPDLADRARQGWAWWVDELRAMVPRALLVRSSDRAASIDCLLLPDGRIAFDLARAGQMPSASEAREPDEAAAARLAVLRAAARRPTVRLSVPRDICLSRRSVLPVRALAHAGAILRHEIEARMPIEPEGILCDWYVETEDTGAGTLHVVQIALARAHIARAEAAFAAAGLAMTHLTVGDGEARPVPVDLVGRHEPSLHAAFLGLPLAAKLLLAAALALALYAPFEAAGRLAGAADAMAQTRAGLPKVGPAAVSAAAVADSLEARATRRPLAALLDELSRRLPRAASVTRLDYRGETLTLGLTGAPGETARTALAGSPMFASVTAGPDDTLVLAVAAAPGDAPAAQETGR
ncbi:hypothetical protein [Aureimonas pseudogalii]|uniref:Uncharacterized protein n=1 Tax=Aureimonas pseudogalii TaxID=1744844 RepID=A0A7W6EBL4_9HYPH|nr:hypothetical protein [Aureimonas pseudogalii]MBB3997046.1 hypothetical protein [Aureimonas pseudogalii]